MKRTGLKLSDDGDLHVGDRGAVVGDTGIQNQYLILIAEKGSLKENPILGATINEMIGDEDVLSWNYRIRSELEADGMRVEKVDIDLNTGKVNIIAE